MRYDTAFDTGFMTMKVFLTGATGLVGAHTAIELLSHGYQVRMLVRKPALAEQWFAQQGFNNVDIVQGDMLNQSRVESAMQGCDAVIHAAAIIDLDTSAKQETIKKNLQGVENVINTACRLGIKKIIYVSSITAIFSSDSSILNENRPVSENQDPYTRSKVICEEHVRELQQQGQPVIITYPSGIFGPDDPKLSQSNEGLMLLYRDIVPITGSGMQFIDVRDVAKAHRLLLEADLDEDKTQERYVLGGHFLPWADFANALQAVGHKKIRRIYLPGALFRGLGRLLDIIRLLVPISYPISYESAVMVTKMPECSSARLQQKTGMEFIPYEETFADTLQWLYKEGYLP